MVTPFGVVSTLAGGGGASAAGFADGFGTSSMFNNPDGVTTGPEGIIYIADVYNHRIRKLSSIECPASFYCSLGSGVPAICPQGSFCKAGSISGTLCAAVSSFLRGLHYLLPTTLV